MIPNKINNNKNNKNQIWKMKKLYLGNWNIECFWGQLYAC